MAITIIKKNRLFLIITFILIWVMFLDTILRINPDIKISLFRAISPILLIFLSLVKPKSIVYFLIFSIGAIVYSYLVTFFVSPFSELSIIFLFYFISLGFIYILVQYLVRLNGEQNFFKLLYISYIITIVLAFIQFFFGGIYPNTQNRLPEINIFFWNGNELAAVLSSFMIILLLLSKSKNKYILYGLGFVVMIMTGSRMTQVSTFIFFFIYIILKFNIRYDPKFLIILLSSGLVLIFVFQDVPIFDVTVYNIFIQPFESIFTLNELEHYGSINMRINAIIVGTKNIFSTYFLGIGPGNSLPMMENLIIPGMEAWSAYSMHNLIMQILTEWGVFGLFFLLFFFSKAVKNTMSFSNPKDRFLVFFTFVFMTINVSISSGPWANYYYLTIFYFSIISLNEQKVKIYR